jgi:hypothetical protein
MTPILSGLELAATAWSQRLVFFKIQVAFMPFLPTVTLRGRESSKVELAPSEGIHGG